MAVAQILAVAGHQPSAVADVGAARRPVVGSPGGRGLGRRLRLRRLGVRQKVGEGVPIAQPLVENPVFPAMVSQMVKIGEETGELEKMLGKIADFYEDEVDASIQSLTSIVEPIMMLGVGLMVGVVIISMYLPMFKLLTLIK